MILEAFSLSLIAAAALPKFTDPRPLGCLAIQSSSVVVFVPNPEPAVRLERRHSREGRRSPDGLRQGRRVLYDFRSSPELQPSYARPGVRLREVGHRSAFARRRASADKSRLCPPGAPCIGSWGGL